MELTLFQCGQSGGVVGLSCCCLYPSVADRACVGLETKPPRLLGNERIPYSLTGTARRTGQSIQYCGTRIFTICQYPDRGRLRNPSNAQVSRTPCRWPLTPSPQRDANPKLHPTRHDPFKIRPQNGLLLCDLAQRIGCLPRSQNHADADVQALQTGTPRPVLEGPREVLARVHAPRGNGFGYPHPLDRERFELRKRRVWARARGE